MHHQATFDQLQGIDEEQILSNLPQCLRKESQIFLVLQSLFVSLLSCGCIICFVFVLYFMMKFCFSLWCY